MAIRKIKAALVNTRDAPEYNTEIGYLFYDADPNGDLTLRISDGVTPGGIPIGGAGGGLSYARLNVVGDDSTGAVLNLGNATPDLQFAGTQNISVNVDNTSGKVTITGPNLSSYLQSGDNISSLTNDAGYITAADVFQLTVADDSSTTSTLTKTDTLNIRGSQNISTSISGDTLTITGPDLTSYIQSGDNISSLTNDAGYITSADVFELTVSDDSSTTQTFTKTDTLNIRGAQNITTALSGDTLTITGPDLTSYIQSGDNISSLTNDAGYITSADVFQLTVADDSSTTSTLTKTDTLNIRGAGGITTSISGDTVTIDGTAVQGASSLSVFGDDSTNMEVDLNNQDLTVSGGNSITTSTSSTQTLTVSLDADISVNNINPLDSSGVNVNGDLYVNGSSVIKQGDNISLLANDAGYINTATLTIVGDDSTGTTFNAANGDNVRFLGAGGTSVTVSGSTVIITSSGGGGGGTTYTQDTAPTSPVDGDTWLDTDSGGLYVYVVEGSNPGQWIETGSAGTTLDVDGVDSIRFAADDSASTPVRTSETLSILGGQGISTAVTGQGEIRISSTGATVVTDDTAPTSPADGDLWYDTDTGSFYVNVVEGSSANWIEVGSAGGPGPRVFTQDDSPSVSANGDFWWDTDAGALYIRVVEGSTGYWIETAGSGSAGGGGITSLAADSTPELGGHLDANSYNITNISTLSLATNGNPGTDPATDSGVGYIYAKGTTAELYVKDGAGNITQISPHSEEGDWVYYSENVKTGKRVKVNMEKMIRRLEQITGEKFFEIDDPHKIKY